MRVKDGFMLREIAGQWVIVPLGARVVEFNAIMTLSESGALLWKALTEGATIDDMIGKIRSEYLIDEETARRDILVFVKALKEKNLLEE